MSEQSPSPTKTPNLLDVLDRIGASAILATPESRTAFVQNLTPERFTRICHWLNGLARGIPPKERGFAPPDVITQIRVDDELGYIAPPPESRAGLTTAILQGLQQPMSDEARATLFGTGMLALHGYEDGNGRMTRVGAEMLRRGYNGSRLDRAYYERLLENTSGQSLASYATDIAQLEQQFADRTMREVLRERGLESFLPRGIFDFSMNVLFPNRDENYAQRNMGHLITEHDSGVATALLYLLETGKDLSLFIFRDENGQPRIDPHMLIKNIPAEDHKVMWDIFGKFKERFVQAIIDHLAHEEQGTFGDREKTLDAYREHNGAGRTYDPPGQTSARAENHATGRHAAPQSELSVRELKTLMNEATENIGGTGGCAEILAGILSKLHLAREQLVWAWQGTGNDHVQASLAKLNEAIRECENTYYAALDAQSHIQLYVRGL